MIELRLRRTALRPTYTIGKLEQNVNGKWQWLCDVVEDAVRDLNKNGKFDNGEQKIWGQTAIPYGTYRITMHVQSPKFSNYNKYPYAKRYNGYMPRLMNVPHFEGILIHPGRSANSSAGCLIVGENKVKGGVVNSVATWERLMDNVFIPAQKSCEKITIEIV